MPHMELDVFKGDGWAIETDDGTVYAPDIDAPDAEALRAEIGSGRKVQVGDVYGRVEAVEYLRGWWGRYSAPGYLDATPWLFNRNKRELLRELRDYYGDENPKGLTRKEERQYKAIARAGKKRYGKRAKQVAARTVLKARTRRRLTAKGRRRRSNPQRSLSLGPYGPKGGGKFTVETSYFQGYATDIAYQRELDGKLYHHAVETDAAEVYLCKSKDFGNCLLIVDPSGKTPLWK